MKTRWKSILRECIGNIHRELNVTFIPYSEPQKWLFVVGCYNSGTTLLSEVLSQHKDISGLPTEGHFLTDQLISDYKIGLPRMWVSREDLFRAFEDDDIGDVGRIKKEWIIRLDRSKPVFLEKSPSNGAKMRWLQANFENSYFISVVRNGYATAEGIRRKAEPMHLKNGWPIRQCAYQWRRSNEVLEEDSEHINNYLQVKYEDFVDDPTSVVKKINTFVGIECEEGDMNYKKNWSIHERKQPIMNLNQDSIDRLTQNDINIINEVASDMLLEYGYTVL
jgi:hypothetical protein